MSLLVLEPGLETRIVDLGRPGTRSLGVPVGGAADRRSLTLGNSLVGNSPESAALEITLRGPRLRAEANVGCVLFGAPFEARRDGLLLEPGHTFTLREGEEIRIGGTQRGARGYLCVRGGLDLPAVLGSRSGLEPIRKGDRLPCVASDVVTRFCPDLAWSEPEVRAVAAVPGLQACWFNESEFFGQTFTVAPASNRMGLRLQGRALTLPGREMISEPVCPGSVQIANDGQCIVLGVDGQTIGGYPKIAQVIQADLDTLGQLRPGQALRFEKITLPDATRRARERLANLREWGLRLRLSLDAFPAERRFA